MRSPAAFIRQKSFHTLSELAKICQNKSAQPKDGKTCNPIQLTQYIKEIFMKKHIKLLYQEQHIHYKQTHMKQHC